MDIILETVKNNNNKKPTNKKYPNGGYALKSWQNAKEQFFRKKKI